MGITLLGTPVSGVRNNSSGTTISATFTQGVGGNRIAIVFSAIEDDAAIASCTWGGVAMTAMTEKAHSSGGTCTRMRMFYLLNAGLPADGALTVTMTSTNAFLSGVVHAFMIQNAKQQAPEATGNGESTANVLVSYSITTLTNNAMILSGTACGVNGTATHGAGQTEILDVSSGATNPLAMATSYEVKTTAGAETESHSWSSAPAENIAYGAAFEFGEVVPGDFFDFF